MEQLSLILRAFVFTLVMMLPTFGSGAEVDRFAGHFMGEAETILEGEIKPRMIEVSVVPGEEGFSLSWTSTSFKESGKNKEASYSIEFVSSERDHIYGSAMQTNIFGKQVPLDPLKGEPFVWSRFEGDTFSVFSLFINQAGDYELQEYHRTLAEGGMNLLFRGVNNGVPQREVRAFLARQE